MEIVLFILLSGFLFLLSGPLVTAYCATTRGRRFGIWFMWGCFLPGISLLLLLLLPDHSKSSPEKSSPESAWVTIAQPPEESKDG